MPPYIRRQFKGNVATNDLLNGTISSSALSFALSSGATFPDGSVGPFVVTMDPGNANEEKILCASRSGATVTVASGGRGYDNTTAAQHTNNAVVEHTISAIDVDEANQLVAALLGGLHSPDGGAPITGQTVQVDTTLTPPVKLVGGTGWTAWTPTLSGTGWVVGNATLLCAYRKLDAKTVVLRVYFVIGSTTTIGSGALRLSLPGGMTVGALGAQQILYGTWWNGATYPASAGPTYGDTVLQPVVADSGSSGQIRDGVSSAVGSGAANGSVLALSGILEIQ